MSRPRKPVNSRLKITAISMPPIQKAQLEALSHQTGLTMQEHIRRALDGYFLGLQKEGRFDPASRRPDDAPRMGRPPKDRPRPQLVQPEPPRRRVFRRPGMSMSA